MNNINVYLTILIACLIIIMTGCASASLVGRQYSGQKGGTVKYLNEGAVFVVNSRKADAENKMKQYCNGPYEITSDANIDQPGYIMYGGIMSSNYVYINFKCI